MSWYWVNVEYGFLVLLGYHESHAATYVIRREFHVERFVGDLADGLVNGTEVFEEFLLLLWGQCFLGEFFIGEDL